MRTRTAHSLPIFVLTTITWIFALTLAGCSGDDGATGPRGPEGPPGDPGTIASISATAIDVTIDNVTIDSSGTTRIPVVDFSIVDQDGIAFIGLGASSIRFTLAKLIPGLNNEASAWQSYINRVEDPGGVGPGTESTIQATSENNGVLENHGNGTYTYTFATDLAAVSSPIAVEYEPTYTHRLATQISGGDVPVANAVYTFQPSTGATTAIDTRDMVKTATCNECHNRLALHGSRIEVQYCVTCHNPGSTDANSGNTVDFKVMIHKIHMGEELPSVIAGTPYVIYGFRNTPHDYSTVVFPQDHRHCNRCHNEADTDTPQAGNWKAVPTIEACGSCHDNVDFSQGVAGGHPGGVATNAQCTTCHATGQIAGGVDENHVIPAEVAAEAFQYHLINIANTAPGQFPAVHFSVTDPTSNTRYNLAADPAWTAGGGASRLAISIGWDTGDYNNTGSGSSPAQPISINALGATANPDGSYTATSTVAIPADATGTAVVTIDGHPAGDFDGDGTYSDRVPVTNVLDYSPITATSASARRTVVDIDKCLQCHAVLSLHGNNRTDEPQVCVVCHNPNATDYNRRPSDAATAADGKREESIDFKRLIHAVHAGDAGEHGFRENGIVVYGFGGSVNDFSHVRFPGRLADCRTCHDDGTYELPLAAGVLGSTIQTVDPALVDPDAIANALADPDDDLNITPTAAVCSSCHDDVLAQAHMEQNGGAFAARQVDIDAGVIIETCVVCHGPGRQADVELVHGIE